MRIKLIAVSLLLASCSRMSTPGVSFLEPYKIDIQQGNFVTAEMREKVSLGMSQAVVKSILGLPLVSDPFHADRWDYVYSMERGGKLTFKQRLTLYFRDGNLVRIDDSHMPAAARKTEKSRENKQETK